MYDPPVYLWAIIIAGITAIPAATCVVLYGGAVRAGLGRTRTAQALRFRYEIVERTRSRD